MNLEFALKYVIDHKQGLVSDLDKKVGEGTTNSLVATNMVKGGYGSGEYGSETWEVTQQAKNIYQSFYKRPSLIESLKGYYCHYILKF